MELWVYNTLTRRKEKFVPYYDEGKKNFVWVYTCWPTVYSTPHIGNLRSFVFASLLGNVIRTLLWYPTVHVMNITDVGHLTDDWDDWEDKLEKWANREWVTAWDIAAKYEAQFKKYVENLDMLFDEYPRATENIQEQIDIIKSLEERWLTYKIEGDGIYMDTSNISDYGKLMWENYKKHIENLKEWARVDNVQKRNPTDFALWKFSPEDKKRHMERESPWWVGFPWWHIECSAMSRKYLGDYFDIHTWGPDHVNTHHTNEIAQSECSFAQNKPWVKYWVHTQFLRNNGEKFSKSSGDDLSLEGLYEKWFLPMDLKYFFYTAHYRSFLDFSRDSLEKSKNTRNSIIRKLVSFKHIKAINMKWVPLNDLRSTFSTDEWDDFLNQALGYILDDFDTPGLLSFINKNLTSPNYEIIKSIWWIDENILKLNLFADAREEINNIESIQIPKYIEQIAEQRQKEKHNKNYEKADELRDRIYEHWFKIIDNPDWSYQLIHKSRYF